MKKKTAWAVVGRSLAEYWPNTNIGFYAVFPSAAIAKQFVKNSTELVLTVVKCTITY